MPDMRQTIYEESPSQESPKHSPQSLEQASLNDSAFSATKSGSN